MKRIIWLLFTFLFLSTPVYANSSFQYSRQIQTDGSIGYKSVVIDMVIFEHSNQLNNLRIFNENNEEIPYLLTSAHDALTEKEMSHYIRSENADYTVTQNAQDSVITMNLNHLDAYSLELETNEIVQRTFGLYGLKANSTQFLLDGELISHKVEPDQRNSAIITWSKIPYLNQLRLIIHNRESEPLNLRTISIKYYVNKLVFNVTEGHQYHLAYGNNSLRSPIYNLKAITATETITESSLGSETNNATKTDLPKNQLTSKTLLATGLLIVGLLIIIITRVNINKKRSR